jgi:dienelactone hydrolase
MQTEDMIYRDGPLTMSGFVAYDERRTGPRPGILVVHEGWGLGEHVMSRCKMLADLGYVAFAADLFGDRLQVSTREEAMALIADLRANPQKLRTRTRAALTALGSLPQTDSHRLGAIGFSFGGTTVLELARDGAELGGVVSFHGGLETAMPAVPGEVKARILVCNGADDPMVPPEQVKAFTEEMQKAGADARVVSYAGAAHGFTNPKADGSIAPGIVYNGDADRQSWAAMQAFFSTIFGQRRAA